MTATLEQIALENLRGTIPREHSAWSTKEEALEDLRRFTGCDFGDDIEAWEKKVAEVVAARWARFDREREAERGGR